LSGRVGDLTLATAPFVKSGLSTRRLMAEVLLALIPVAAAATWFFGLAAPLVILASSAGAVGAEAIFRGTREGLGSLADGTGLLTGVLLGLILPPSIPLWMAFLGGGMGILLGKTIWGGLGQNLFNPALVGRAFLQAAFPTTLTTWTAPGTDLLVAGSSTLSVPLGRGTVDAVTTATPLGLAKFSGEITPWDRLFTGNIAGSLGETSALVLIVCGLWLAARKVFDWRLPVATLLTVAALSQALHFFLPAKCPDGLFMLLSGGLLFGAVFMVTDPVTTPITPRGMWLFGLGVGILVVLIRIFGGLPEGVMYAILLMNAATPLINRLTQPRRFGG
jgi:electron transport complex protein RnfD